MGDQQHLPARANPAIANRTLSVRGTQVEQRRSHLRQLKAEPGKLGRLSRARLPGRDDHLVILDRSEQVVATRGYRQLRRVGDLGD
jgi:hypothetical protein